MFYHHHNWRERVVRIGCTVRPTFDYLNYCKIHSLSHIYMGGGKCRLVCAVVHSVAFLTNWPDCMGSILDGSVRIRPQSGCVSLAGPIYRQRSKGRSVVRPKIIVEQWAACSFCCIKFSLPVAMRLWPKSNWRATKKCLNVKFELLFFDWFWHVFNFNLLYKCIKINKKYLVHFYWFSS